jgi:hypothetical protein
MGLQKRSVLSRALFLPLLRDGCDLRNYMRLVHAASSFDAWRFDPPFFARLVYAGV